MFLFLSYLPHIYFISANPPFSLPVPQLSNLSLLLPVLFSGEDIKVSTRHSLSASWSSAHLKSVIISLRAERQKAFHSYLWAHSDVKYLCAERRSNPARCFPAAVSYLVSQSRTWAMNTISDLSFFGSLTGRLPIFTAQNCIPWAVRIFMNIQWHHRNISNKSLLGWGLSGSFVLYQNML